MSDGTDTIGTLVNGNGAPNIATIRTSPFFHTPSVAAADSLAILHLKRDSLIPITLQTTADDGYAEGAVTNTRFGSYPHSTLINAEWGSQIRASKVDTGSRGRKPKQPKAVPQVAGGETNETEPVNGATATTRKRKSSGDTTSPDSPSKKQKPSPTSKAAPPPALKAAVEAGTGFAHLVQPTPESWTSSLDHRTQVVYTPDYSYILQKLRVKPGQTIIEAGAGSGSFTHAAARAVFNGYPHNPASSGKPSSIGQLGKVCSFEYHESRVATLREELTSHGLDGIVQLTHRDVYNDGFTLADGCSPQASAVFLDLPAPQKALKHPSRENSETPLHQDEPAHICAFLPCIEQVQTTVSALRKAGWTEIQMQEISQRRIDVRRERVGLREEGLRGVNANAANVGEALERLREVEAKLTDFHAAKKGAEKTVLTKAQRLAKIKVDLESRKLFKEGRLVHRTEAEVRTHTSYLVFAVLPVAWSAEEEARAAKQWEVEAAMESGKTSAKITEKMMDKNMADAMEVDGAAEGSV